jgi:signal transduction histidine kinase
VGVPAYDETGNTYGLLAGVLSLESLGLEALLRQARVGEQGVVYLVDGSGQILARTPPEQARNSLAGHTGLAVALQDASPGATLCHAPDGERMTLAYAPVDFGRVGWRVLIEEPWREVIGPVLRYSQFMPLVAALAVIVSLLTLYYGVRSIVQPLQALGQEAERVAWGDFEATSTPVGGVEEIEDLRRTLDQMAKRIQGYQGGMHDYIAAINQGQEEERKRLARELHDETAQALIALGQRVEMAQKLLIADPQRAAERLSRVRAMLAETVEGVRRFSRDLRPIYLEDLGFMPALEMLVRQADQEEALLVHLTTIGQVRRLPSDLELAAYRIVQEALNNVIQHARASQAWVEVRFEVEHLVLSVRDDGQGFDAPDLPDVLARQGHFGLMGIQERALLYSGHLTIRAAPGEGTEIAVRLPYPPP